MGINLVRIILVFFVRCWRSFFSKQHLLKSGHPLDWLFGHIEKMLMFSIVSYSLHNFFSLCHFIWLPETNLHEWGRASIFMIAILKNQIRAPHISLYNVSHSIYFLPLEKSHLLPFEARIIPCLSCTISCPSMTMMLARNLHIFRNIYAICFDGNTYTNKIMH